MTFKMLFNRDKRHQKEKEDAIAKQRQLDYEEFLRREQKIRATNENTIDSICKKHTEQLEQIRKNERARFELESQERLIKYRRIVEQKVNLINELQDENKKLRAALRRHKEAYEMYRPYRDQIIALAKSMKQASERIRMSGAEIDQYFARLEETADAHLRAMIKLEPKIEEKMRADEPTEAPHLVLIESKSS